MFLFSFTGTFPACAGNVFPSGFDTNYTRVQGFFPLFSSGVPGTRRVWLWELRGKSGGGDTHQRWARRRKETAGEVHVHTLYTRLLYRLAHTPKDRESSCWKQPCSFVCFIFYFNNKTVVFFCRRVSGTNLHISVSTVLFFLSFFSPSREETGSANVLTRPVPLLVGVSQREPRGRHVTNTPVPLVLFFFCFFFDDYFLKHL